MNIFTSRHCSSTCYRTCVTPTSHSLDRVPPKQHARLMCLPVFTTVYGTARSSDCHSYLHCKYGKQCSGRDLKIAPPRASVTKLINGGTGAERVLTMQVSLSSHPFLLSPAVLFSSRFSLSFSLDCGLIRLNYTGVLSFIIGMGPGFCLRTPNKY